MLWRGVRWQRFERVVRDCGDVELTTRDVEVRVCTARQPGHVLVPVPGLSMVVVIKPAEPRIVELLVASGVRLSTWSLPAELLEPRSGGEPISHDDLLDFHTLMQRDDWIDSLDRSTRARSSAHRTARSGPMRALRGLPAPSRAGSLGIRRGGRCQLPQVSPHSRSPVLLADARAGDAPGRDRLRQAALDLSQRPSRLRAPRLLGRSRAPVGSRPCSTSAGQSARHPAGRADRARAPAAARRRSDPSAT